MWRVLVCVGCVALMGCGGDAGEASEGGGPSSTVGVPVEEGAPVQGVPVDEGAVPEGVPGCSELVGPVDVAAVSETGCVFDDGSVGIVISYPCDDGRTAVAVGDRAGVEGGDWGPADDEMILWYLC